MDIKQYFRTARSTIASVATVILFIGSIVSGMMFLENRYAKAGDLQVVKTALHIKIAEDRSFQLQTRVWDLEDKHSDLVIKTSELNCSPGSTEKLCEYKKNVKYQLRNAKYDKQKVDTTLENLLELKTGAKIE